MDSAEECVWHSAPCSWDECTRDRDDSNILLSRNRADLLWSRGTSKNGLASYNLNFSEGLHVLVLHKLAIWVVQFKRRYRTIVVMYGPFFAYMCCLLFRLEKSATVLTVLLGITSNFSM